MTAQKPSATLDASAIGPIDLIAVEFPGNRFKGEILRDLHELVAAGTIRIIDLVIVSKSDAGQVSVLELQDLDPESRSTLAPLQAAISQMLTREDLEDIGAQLANKTTSAVMLYENTWAVKTKQAILDANGRLLVQARVPHDVVQETLNDMAAYSASLP
jgi:hypothetical protein